MRRGSGSSAPRTTSSGHGDLHADPAGTDCIDTNAKNGTLYGYAVFAIDAAGNVARREATARASTRSRPMP